MAREGIAHGRQKAEKNMIYVKYCCHTVVIGSSISFSGSASRLHERYYQLRYISGPCLSSRTCSVSWQCAYVAKRKSSLVVSSSPQYRLILYIPFVAIIRRCLEISVLLLCRHGIPFPRFALIAPSVVEVGERILHEL